MNRLKILFMGRKKYAAQMLKWLYDQGQEIVSVVTDSHFPDSPTAAMARSLGIPVISLEESEKMVKNAPNSIDLVVSYLFWRKIKEPLISSPRLGCINFHPAILPDWKGTAGYNLAILNKLDQWGASAHYINDSIDTGDIIKVFRFSFDYRNETAQTLEEKTQKIQCDLFKSVLTDILETGEKAKITDKNIGGQYISKNQMLEMMKINPEKDDVDLKIHAFWFPPYNGAYIEINGKIYTLVDDFILKQLKAPDQTANNC
nr:formyltransferase family protein [uncultured Aminipila sp.]